MPGPRTISAVDSRGERGNTEGLNKQEIIDSGGAFAKNPGIGPQVDRRLGSYLAAQGASRARQQEEIQRRIEAVERARSRGLEDIGRDEQRGLEGIGDRYESRGLFRSGRRERDQGRLSSDSQLSRDRLDEDSQLQLDAIERARQAIGRGGRSTAALRQQFEMDAINDLLDQNVIPGGVFSDFDELFRDKHPLEEIGFRPGRPGAVPRGIG